MSENLKIYTLIFKIVQLFKECLSKLISTKQNIKISTYNYTKNLQIYNSFNEKSTFYKFIFKIFYIYCYPEFLQISIFSTFYKLKNGNIYNVQQPSPPL